MKNATSCLQNREKFCFCFMTRYNGACETAEVVPNVASAALVNTRVHRALCHHHMSTHCLPLGRRSLWLTKTQVTCHYTNEPCYSGCSAIHTRFFCRAKWNHIIMHLFMRRFETAWGSLLCGQCEQEQLCQIAWPQRPSLVPKLHVVVVLVQCNLISC